MSHRQAAAPLAPVCTPRPATMRQPMRDARSRSNGGRLAAHETQGWARGRRCVRGRHSSCCGAGHVCTCALTASCHVPRGHAPVLLSRRRRRRPCRSGRRRPCADRDPS
eukprot:363788-Prymnesium_polylepis.2